MGLKKSPATPIFALLPPHMANRKAESTYIYKQNNKNKKEA